VYFHRLRNLWYFAHYERLVKSIPAGARTVIFYLFVLEFTSNMSNNSETTGDSGACDRQGTSRVRMEQSERSGEQSTLIDRK